MALKTKYEVSRSGNSPFGRVVRIKDFTYEVNPQYRQYLVAQPCTLKRSNETAFSPGDTLPDGSNNTGMSTASNDAFSIYALNPQGSVATGVYNRAYGKFVSKLKNSDAALGVTLGSYKETHGMLQDRYQKMNDLFHRATSDRRIRGMRRGDFLRYSLTGTGSKKALNYIANSHLEYVFGWYPLYKDIVATVNTLSELTIPDSWVTTNASTYFENKWKEGLVSGQGVTKYSSFGTYRVTLGALVKVTNPHLYLANRLGLTNLPGVAWDLVPWSFVVNMFVNANSVISSFTDFAGLSYSQLSTTRTLKGTGYQDFIAGPQHVNPKLRGHAAAFHYDKRRTVGGSFSRPSLVIRLPTVSGGLIGIASALSVQQISRLGSLLR